MIAFIIGLSVLSAALYLWCHDWRARALAAEHRCRISQELLAREIAYSDQLRQQYRALRATRDAPSPPPPANPWEVTVYVD